MVHENHGLGIFRGIEKIEVDKTMRDYMKIEYDKGGNLYVLATQLDLIQNMPVRMRRTEAEPSGRTGVDKDPASGTESGTGSGAGTGGIVCHPAK